MGVAAVHRRVRVAEVAVAAVLGDAGRGEQARERVMARRSRSRQPAIEQRASYWTSAPSEPEPELDEAPAERPQVVDHRGVDAAGRPLAERRFGPERLDFWDYYGAARRGDLIEP